MVIGFFGHSFSITTPKRGFMFDKKIKFIHCYTRYIKLAII